MSADTIDQHRKIAEQSLWVRLTKKVVLPATYVLLVAGALACLLQLLGLGQLIQPLADLLGADWLRLHGPQRALRLLPFFFAYLFVTASISGYTENYYFKLRTDSNLDNLFYSSVFFLHLMVLIVAVAMNFYPWVGLAGFVAVNLYILVAVELLIRSLRADNPARRLLEQFIRKGAIQRLVETAAYGALFVLWTQIDQLAFLGVSAEEWRSDLGHRIHEVVVAGIGWLMSISVAYHAQVKVLRVRVSTQGSEDILKMQKVFEQFYREGDD